MRPPPAKTCWFEDPESGRPNAFQAKAVNRMIARLEAEINVRAFWKIGFHVKKTLPSG